MIALNGELAGLLSAAGWAATSLLIRSQTARLSAITINLLRCGTAGLLAVLAAVLLRSDALLAGVPLLALLLLLASVALAPGLGDTLYFESLRLVGVARAMALSGTNPLFAAAFAVLLLGEQVSLLMLAGILLVVLGVYFLTTRVQHDKPRDARRGVALALAAAALWAGGTIAVAPALREVDIFVANAIRLPATAIAIGLYGWRSGRLTPIADLQPRPLLTIAAAGAIGVCSTLLYLTAVQQAGAARTAALTSTSPLFGAPIALLLFREQLTLRLLLGTVLSIAGVALVVIG